MYLLGGNLYMVLSTNMVYRVRRQNIYLLDGLEFKNQVVISPFPLTLIVPRHVRP
jgi:hypothetical protein